MEDIQQSQWIFYLPLLSGYGIACAVSLLFFRQLGMMDSEEDQKPEKPWFELILALLAVIAVFAIGRVYSAGYLISLKYNHLAWILNNLIIYSPIFILLIIRRQSAQTIWISPYKWPLKIAAGILSSIIALFIFLTLRSEWYRWLPMIEKSFSVEGMSNFIAIFLEGVVLAFLFVRLKWATNLLIALIIPAILFSGAHLPGMIADGDPWWHMVLMSLATGTVTVLVLYTCYRTKDIIWIGLVHYFMDAAINAY